MHKTNLMATAILAFGLGGFTGVMTTNNDLDNLKVNIIHSFQHLTMDIEQDLEEGVIDSTYADYYLYKFKRLEEGLTYTPERYTVRYE
jgi:hypothetical protein